MERQRRSKIAAAKQGNWQANTIEETAMP